MALKTLVKASVNNLTDARYFAALEVEWLSFNLDASTEGSVTPAQLKEMSEWIAGPKIVGEFKEQDAEEINHVADTIGLDAIQLNNKNSEAGQIRFPIMQKVVVEEVNALPYELMQYKKADFFVLSFNKNWQDLSEAEKEELKVLCAQYQVLLNLEFNEENILEIIEQISPLGIDITGGEEEAVGLKNFEQIDAVMEKLEFEA